jgi:hypothetical protein
MPEMKHLDINYYSHAKLFITTNYSSKECTGHFETKMHFLHLCFGQMKFQEPQVYNPESQIIEGISLFGNIIYLHFSDVFGSRFDL